MECAALEKRTAATDLAAAAAPDALALFLTFEVRPRCSYPSSGSESCFELRACMGSTVLRFRVEKLIRDGMLEVMHSEGLRTFERTLDAHELERRLLDKLVEEAEEVRAASTRAELVEELADVHEVLLALMTAHGVSQAEVEATRLDKRARYGGFDRSIYNDAVEAAADSKAAEYYLARPAKYPRT